MNTSEEDQYISCKLANENKWFTEKAEWSDYIAKRHKDAISLIVSDSRGVIYILCSNKQKTKYSLYQQMPNRKLQKLNIDDIYIRQKEKKLLSFNLIDENRLVFFFSQEQGVIKCDTVNFCNEFPTPILGIANMEKVAGGDREFYLMTWKNAEFSDFEWIHYVTE